MSISAASRVRFFSGLIFSLMGSLAWAEQVPQVTVFQPVGMQREVLQVQMRFSDEIVALGDDKARDPATVECKGSDEHPVGHWQNGRTWVAEFAHPLPDGVACTVSPGSIKTLTGESVAAASPWSFNTGGPQIISLLAVDENRNDSFANIFGSSVDNVAAFSISTPVDASTLDNLRCRVGNLPRTARVLTGRERNAAYSRIWKLYRPSRQEEPLEDSVVVAQCGDGPLPHNVQLTWTWGKGIASKNGVTNAVDDERAFHVPPMILGSLPSSMSDRYNELHFDTDPIYTHDQFAAFSFLIPADGYVRKGLRCDGKPASILSGAERITTYLRLWKQYWGNTPAPAIDDSWVVAQCFHKPPIKQTVGWTLKRAVDGKSSVSTEPQEGYANVAYPIWHRIFASARITKEPLTIFATSRPIDEVSLQHLHCLVNRKEYPVRILHDAEESDAYARMRQRYRQEIDNFRAKNKFIAQCGKEPWPDNAIVRWEWGKAIATEDGVASERDEVLDFAVNPPLWAEVHCTELVPAENCDVRKNINYVFSNDIAATDASRFTLRGSSGKVYLATDAGVPTEHRMISFPGPFVEGESLKLQWQSDFRDVDGRELKFVAPERAVTAHLPSYLGMTKTDDSFQWQVDHSFLWPLAVRNTEKEVKVRTWQFGQGPGSTPALLALLDLTAQRKAVGYAVRTEDLLQEFYTSHSIVNSLPGVLPKSVDQMVPTSSANMNFVGIPLNGYGVWLLEADSPVYRKAMANRLVGMRQEVEQRYPLDESNNRVFFDKFDSVNASEKNARTSVVQLSNLQINMRLSLSGRSLAWITAADSGKPVADATVEIWSCAHKYIAGATSDAQGLVLFDGLGVSLRPTFDMCDEPYGYRSERFWIVARSGNDVTALNSVDYQNRYPFFNYRSSGNGAVGHTILDRTLFHPGETVSMQHFARLTGAGGWTIPAQGEGKLRITNPMGEEVADEALTWDSNGSAESKWTFPEGAKLGTYGYTVEDAQQRTVSRGSFELEEFRIPLFDTHLRSETFWRGNTQKIRLNANLEFKTGGAASGESVRFTGAYRNGWFSPIDEDQLGINRYSFADLELPPVPMPEFEARSLKLDRHGRIEFVEPVPQTDAFLLLETEMQFPDADGEIKTTKSYVSIAPKKLKVGLHVEPSKEPDVVSVETIVLDENNKPKANQLVTIDFAEAAWRNDASVHEDFSEKNIILKSPRTLAYTVQTDEHGKARCSVPWHLATESNGLLFRARADGASTASVEADERYFIWMPPQPMRPLPPPILARTTDISPKIGEVEHLQVRSPFLPATLLLTVEREGVLSSQVHYLTKEIEYVDVPMEANFAPNVQIVAQFARGSAGLSADHSEFVPPIHLETLGLALDPITNTLAVNVQPAKLSTHPGQSLDVKLTVTHALDKSPAAGAKLTLIAVDEGLLELHPNSTWALLQAFWTSRYGDVFGLGSKNTRLGVPALGLQPEYIPEAEASAMRDRIFQPGGTKSVSKLEGGADPNSLEALLTQIRQGFLNLRYPGNLIGNGDGTYYLKKDGTYRIEVTGTTIKRADKETAENVQVITAQQIKNSGYTTASEVMSNVNSQQRTRRDFTTLAHWQTDITLDEHGEAIATLQMPESLTNWRIVAIATEGSDRYGEGDSKIKTSQSVQILSGLPQTVRSSDVLQQKVTIRNITDSTVNLDFGALAKETLASDIPFARRPVTTETMEANGLKLQRQVTLRRGESKVIAWPFTVPDGAMQLDWQFAAVDKDGNAEIGDAMLVTQHVVPVAPVTVRESTMLLVDGAQSLTVAQPSTATSNAGGVTVRWQDSIVEAAVRGAREWMANYPYSCMEQRSSKAAVSGDPEQWKKAMATLPRHMDKAGFVSYFPDEGGSETLTAYLLDIADAYGLPVPEKEKKRMQNALRLALLGTEFRDWAPGDYVLAQQLALQAAIAPDLGAARPVVPKDLNQLPTLALVDWVRYLLKTPDTAERTERLQAAATQLRSRYDIQGTRAVWRNDRDDNYWWFMWTPNVAIARTALLAQQWSAVDASWKVDAQLLMRGLINRQQDGNWQTTTANAWGVAAMSYFKKNTEHGPVSGSSGATFGGVTQTANWPSPSSMQFPWPEQGAPSLLNLSHEGSGAPWATVQVMAATKSDKSISHGVAVHKTITPYSQRVKGQWSEGDVMRVSLEMSADRDLSWLVVHDPIPSGATILENGVSNFNGNNWWWTPSFVERTNDSFRGYYQRIWSGKWTAEYLVRLNNSGTFNFPATRIEAMYSPEIFGETQNPELIVGVERAE
jgi:uncharacterized protein YfaS (alpha-2-macroglobulin family)